jgi:protein-disulfide isomerase
MSNRNSQEAKRAARERMRAEREKQAKKARVRRQAIVGVSVVAVLAVATGIGYAVTQMNKPTGWDAAKDQKLVKPANTAGKNGTTVTVGGAGAKHTLDVYEDLRCPACAQLEQAAGKVIVNGADQKRYELRVHLGDLIDNNLGGGGSKSAISALGASLNVSKSAYREYHEKLYSAQYHPDEQQDKFSNDSYLLKVANTVPALKNNKGFQKAVKDGTYDKWALDMVGDFDKAKIQGTPTIRLDGKDVQEKQLPATLQKLGVKLPKGADGGQKQKQ